MLPRSPFLAAALVASLSPALPACLLDAGPFEGATDYVGGKGGGTTTGTGASTSQSLGGAGGDTATGGATATGGTATGGTATGGTGGTGGSPPVVAGDLCPGKADSIAVYANLLIDQGDTTPAADNYGSGPCGGGSAPDVVHAIKALGKGILTVTMEPDPSFAGFVQLRTTCDDPNAEKDCGLTVTASVEKDQVVHVIADGHANDVNGLASFGKYKLHVFLDGCGNGEIEEPQEECDDANADPNDTCQLCMVRCTTDKSITADADLFVHPTTHHCYMQSYSPDSTWQSAENDCVAWGGHLAAITSQQEIDDLANLRSGTGQDIWIGGNDIQTDGTFVWTDGEIWPYTNKTAPWAGNEPNGGASEACVEIYKNGQLNDEHCDYTQNWLCERPPAGVPAAQPQ